MPFSPAAQASALYAATSVPATACLSSCQNAAGSMYASPVVSPGAVGPIAEARPGNYGGLNPMSLGPYYDPRTVTIRAPVETVPDGVITAPSLTHGPSAFVGADVLPPRPKTQFAPHGVLQVDKLVLDVWCGPCACGCCAFNPYCVAALVVCAANARVVRDMLAVAGVVVVTPQLAALTPANACACRIMGGPDMFAGLSRFALEYVDTPIVSLLDVGATIMELDRLYVSNVLTDVRSMVISQARANYARAEGPRAYLQDFPVVADADTPLAEDEGAGGANDDLVLAGTGCRVVGSDSKYANLALSSPMASVANRAALACQTGLPIGAAPEIHPVQTVCAGPPPLLVAKSPKPTPVAFVL